MTYGGAPFGGATLGGARDLAAGGGGGVITDPSRPDVVGYRFTTTAAIGAYGQTAWAGGGSVQQSAAGGLFAVPDPDAALVRVAAWWSGSPYLRVVRIIGADTAVPVRGGYPAVVGTPTRRNRCTNPSGEVDTTGWLTGANTMATNPDDAAAPAGSKILRFTATAAGDVNTAVPTGLSTTVPTGISFGLRTAAAPAGALTLTATWLIAPITSGGSTTQVTTTATMSTAALADYVGAFRRSPVLIITPPATGVLQGSLALSVAGLPAGGTVDLDAVLIEDNDSTGVPFDGDSLTGSWIGVPHLSESRLASALEVIDSEAPLDVDLRYELTAPDQPAFRAITDPVVLPSNGRLWLSHPEFPQAMEVTVEREPKQTRPIVQSVLNVLGQQHPVVISSAKRGGPRGTHQIATRYFSDRDQLLDMLDDGSPLLLRMPADHGHGHGEWIAIGDVDYDITGHQAREGTRHFTMPYVVVDAPALPEVAA